MIYSIFPTKDNSIYEDEPTQNCGFDNILELTKIIDDDVTNSRILMEFDLNDIPSTSSVATFYLNLYVSEVANIPISYDINAHPISGSWDVGLGKRHNYPIVELGSSWTYRDSEDNATLWFTTESLATGSTYFYVSESGGGVWYTSSVTSQSFDFETGDIRMDVTDIVWDWQHGVVPNNGLLLKRTNLAESDDNEMGSIKFYSRDTHTIFPPKLEICWDDSSYDTGSLSPLITSTITSDEIIVYPKNLRKQYKETTKTRIRVLGRQRYPRRTYSTTSTYMSVYYLPSSSYYSIMDLASEEVVVPFDDNYTKMSCDSSGNYFNFWANGLQPERYYRFVFKVVDSEGNEEFFDDEYSFKVVR